MFTSRYKVDASVPAEMGWTCFAGCAVAVFSIFFLFQDRQYFWNDDYQTFQLAGYCEIARAWREGEFPLVSPFSWEGGALAAEYQHGVFSIFLTGWALLVFSLDLPLPLAAAAFSIIHLAILAAGAFRLARSRKLALDLSLLVALVTSLNGSIFIWGAKYWFPGLASFAWLPWLWWALERALQGQRSRLRFVPAGLFLYLVCSAGWPFAVLMVGLVSLWLSARTVWEHGRLLAIWPVATAWFLGLGLSAPAWLMLLQYAAHTLRGQTHPLSLSYAWAVPIHSLPGLVFPWLVSPWSVFGTWKPHISAELTGGLVSVAVLGATLARQGQRFLAARAWEWSICGFVLLLCLSPGLGNFQHTFRWLPFFFLILALLAAHGLAALRGAPRPGDSQAGNQPLPNLGLWATGLVVAAWVWTVFLGMGTTFPQGGALLILTCVGWAIVEGRNPPGSHWRRWAPCAVVAVSCWLMYVHPSVFAEVPSWRFDEGSSKRRLDPNIRYLSLYTWPDITGSPWPWPVPPERLASVYGRDATHCPGTAFYPGNSGMYWGIQFVNGYSPMGPWGLAQGFKFGVHGDLSTMVGERLLERETGADGLLQWMAVDGLIVSDSFVADAAILEEKGWELVRSVEGGRIFHRAGAPSPRIRAVPEACWVGGQDEALDFLTDQSSCSPALVVLASGTTRSGRSQRFAPARVTLITEARNSVTVDVENSSPDQEALIVFSRPWYPGYRAVYNAEPLSVSVLNLTMPVVLLPAGANGQLKLEYEPLSLVVGRRVAGVTGAILLLLGLAEAGWSGYSRARARALCAAAKAVDPCLVP